METTLALLFLSPLHRASRQIGIYLASRLGGVGVQNSEGHLLSFLRSYSPAPISELIRVFGLKKSTMTSVLDRLEKRGLLRREAHPTDRRSYFVGITDEGRRLAEAVQRPVEELERRIRDEVDDEDLRGFQRVLESIAKVTAVEVRSQRKETR
jgi:DNA-binding MarR family transcriptional regulator